jgi:hypothetical protein
MTKAQLTDTSLQVLFSNAFQIVFKMTEGYIFVFTKKKYFVIACWLAFGS